MAAKFDDLLAEIMHLSAQDRARLLAALKELEVSAANSAGDPAGTPAETHAETHESTSMTLVTVALPDDLAQQAQDAGLLSESSLERLIRWALDERGFVPRDIPPGQERRLVRNEYGYLVAEAFPGETPISAEEVKRILDGMGW